MGTFTWQEAYCTKYPDAGVNRQEFLSQQGMARCWGGLRGHCRCAWAVWPHGAGEKELSEDKSTAVHSDEGLVLSKYVENYESSSP